MAYDATAMVCELDGYLFIAIYFDENYIYNLIVMIFDKLRIIEIRF